MSKYDKLLERSYDLLLEFAKKLLFLYKTCAIRFQKAKIYQNLTSESGSKQRFSLLQAKAVIQAVCLRTQAVSIKARF